MSAAGNSGSRALGSGLADKGVSLLYERVLRKEQLKLWTERCEGQIGGVLALWKRNAPRSKSPYWFGDTISHPRHHDRLRAAFFGEAHSALFDARYPALKAHAERCEALPPFGAFVQVLAPPKG